MFQFNARFWIVYEYFDNEDKDNESLSKIQRLKDYLSALCKITGCKFQGDEIRRQDLDFAYDQNYEWYFDLWGEFPTLKSYRGATHIFQGLAECVSDLHFAVDYKILDDQPD